MTEAPPDTWAAEEETGGPRLKSENARLRGELSRTEARAERAERALERMERSAKYTVGALLVDAAKDPRKLLLLPRDMWRVWRLRRGRRTSPAVVVAPRGRRDVILDSDAARLLLPRMSSRPEVAFSIVGALSRPMAREWAAAAAVTPTLPHDAADLALAVDPDVVVIESAAALPGEPWAYLGDPSAADRQIAAMRLIDAAHEMGRPVVLLRTTPPWHTAFLDPLARMCDLVLDGPGSRRGDPWNPGIDLSAWARLAPSAGDAVAARRTDALQAPRLSPTDRAVAARIDRAFLDSGTVLLSPDPRVPDAMAAAREASFALADPLSVPDGIVGASTWTVAMLAAGRRVLGGPDADLRRLLRGAESAHVIVDDSSTSDIVADARAPMTDDLRRRVLRSLLLGASAPGQLQVLADRLGLLASPRSCWDVSLVADDVDVDAVLLQSWRPREVVVSSAPSDRVRTSLAEYGVAVTVMGSALPRTREESALACRSPFVVRQADLGDPHAIADLLVERIAGLPSIARPSDPTMWSRP